MSNGEMQDLEIEDTAKHMMKRNPYIQDEVLLNDIDSDRGLKHKLTLDVQYSGMHININITFVESILSNFLKCVR